MAGVQGTRVDSLYWDMALNTAPFMAGAGRATTMLGSLTKALNSPVGAAGALAASLTLVGVKATNMAEDLDKSLREVASILPITGDQVGSLRAQIVDLSTRVPEPPIQLTKGLYQTISAGITETSEAMQVLEVATRAATAGLTDTLTSVDAITTVLNAYQMEAEEATHVSDVLFKTVQLGKTTFPELAGAIGNVATSAALADVSLEEVGAAITTMTKAGLGIDETATALNRFLLSVVQQEKNAVEASEELGFEFSITALKAKGLSQFLRELEEATQGDIEALQAIFPNIRSARAAFLIGGSAANVFQEDLEEMEKATNAARDAFTDISGAADEQWAILKNKVNAIWHELGDVTLPMVIGVLRELNEVLEDETTTRIRTLERLGLQERADALRRIQLLGQTREEIENTESALAGLAAAFIREGEGRMPIRPGSTTMGSRELGVLPEGILTETGFRNQMGIDEDAMRAFIEDALAGQLDIEGLMAEIRERAVDASKHELNVLEEQFELLQQMQLLLEERAEKEGLIADLNKSSQESQGMTLADQARGLRQAAELRAETQRLADIDVSAPMHILGETTQRVGEDLNRVREIINEGDFGLEESLGMDDPERIVDGIRAVERAFAQLASGVSPEKVTLELGMALAELDVELEDLPPSIQAYVEQLREMASGEGDAADAASDLLDTFMKMSRAVIDLASAFGGLDRDASVALNSAANVAQGVIDIAGGDYIKGGIQVVSGIANLVSSLTGESEEDRTLRENNKQLELLREGIATLNESLLSTPVSNINDAIAALEGQLRAFENRGLPDHFRDDTGLVFFNRGLEEALGELGLSMQELEELAQMLGIDFVRTAEGVEQLLGALRQFEIERLFESFAGQLRMLRLEFQLFDIDDPVKQLERFRELMLEFMDLPESWAKAIQSFDLSTASGREKLENFILSLFENPSLWQGMLGDLSVDEFLSIIQQMEGLIDDADAQKGSSSDFGIRRQITEITATRMAGILETGLIYWQASAENTALIAQAVAGAGGLMPPTVGELDGAGGGSAELVIQGDIVVHVTVEAGTDAEGQGREAARGAIRELDRYLGRNVIEERRAQGLPVTG